MADNTPETSDLNRQIHAESIIDDTPDTAEGAFEVNSLSAPGGFLGTAEGMSVNVAFQTLPNPDLHGDGVWEFTGDGDDAQMYEASDGHLKDDDYQMLPDPTLSGGAGTTNMGQQGGAVDWNSVAPDTYPEHFPSVYDTKGVLPALKLYD